MTEPQGWDKRPATADHATYQHNFQAARSFHVGAYSRPRGWTAHHWAYGQTLPRAYWASQYILADYWLFALEVPPTGGNTGDAVTVVAKDIAFKNPDVAVKAGAPVQIVLDNQDGAPHNIAISDANGQGVFKGEIVSNTKVTYNVPALAAGTYTFICEVHPSIKGTITAK